MNAKRQTLSGFTLIELIVTIVIAALAMAAIMPFLGEVFLRSREPAAQLHGILEIQTAMENLVASHTDTLQDLHDRVGAEGELIEGNVRVEENRFVSFDNTQECASEGDRLLLKITLRNALGETLSRLFTEPL